ncbi:MAG: DEAD/DEAH box helicase [Sulfolobales archaeon]|nr:DEAD/DEAH box helicase [Sulfolobales archaeon]MDW8083268.1 DEAD/DEAH box helicase [Sulfolobales archaeon]
MKSLPRIEDVVDVPQILKSLRAVGIEVLLPVQIKAIRSGLLTSRNNIVVVAPTGSGKTLVGYMAILKSVLEGDIGVYLTPLKSVASEKFEELKLICSEFKCRVCVTTGDYDQPSEWLSECDLIVATYERFDSLLRLKPQWIKNVSTVVIDELHTVGDSDRGHVVELVGVRSLSSGCRVLGLSAAVGNPEEVASWLNAELIFDDWRPVKLVEGYYDRISKTIVFEDGRVESVRGDLEQYALREAVTQNYQLLVFRHSRQQAEGLTKILATSSAEKCLELVEEFSRLDPPRVEFDNISYLLSKCVAFHHAGLSSTTRKFIEKSFRERAIRAVVATPTLAAGVNFPARRVLVSVRRYEEGYVRGISIAEYKQMAGRAGRHGLDPYGEVIVSDARSTAEATRYIKGTPEPAISVLTSDRAIRVHTLSLISSRDAESIEQLVSLLKLTLAYKQLSDTLLDKVWHILRDLAEWGMIYREGNYVEPTKLGKTVSVLYVDPVTARAVISGLTGVGSVYDIYYLTLVALTPDFPRIRLGSIKLRELRATMEVLADSGNIPDFPWIDEYDLLRALKIGLILRDWVEEVGEDTIVERYGVGVGDLSVIVESAQWLLYASGVICSTTGLREHAGRLMTLSRRVESGVKEDALELVRVKWIGRARARKLLSNGIKTIEDLTKLSPARLSELLSTGLSIAEEILSNARKIISEDT